MVSLLGIEFTAVSESEITATMPVDSRTIQPFGILHGGASVALAETIGSVAGNLILDSDALICVGLDINANHVKEVKYVPSAPLFVTGVGKPLHLGRSTQIWEINIYNDQQSLVCISRLTLMVKKKPS